MNACVGSVKVYKYTKTGSTKNTPMTGVEHKNYGCLMCSFIC